MTEPALVQVRHVGEPTLHPDEIAVLRTGWFATPFAGASEKWDANTRWVEIERILSRGA